MGKLPTANIGGKKGEKRVFSAHKDFSLLQMLCVISVLCTFDIVLL